MHQAREKAEQERQRLLDEARDESEDSRQRWQQQAEDEKARFLEGLQRETTQGFEQLARKALTDLADAEPEAQILRQFIARLDALDQDARRQLAAAAENEQVQVSTSFALDEPQRQRLSEAIQQQLGAESEIAYQESPQLLCGIELRAGGQRLGWTLAEYLDQFAQRLDNGISNAPG